MQISLKCSEVRRTWARCFRLGTQIKDISLSISFNSVCRGKKEKGKKGGKRGNGCKREDERRYREEKAGKGRQKDEREGKGETGCTVMAGQKR